MATETDPLFSTTSREKSAEMKIDPMVRDKKRLPLSGPDVYLWFFLYLVVVLPFWFSVMLPLTLLSLAITALFNLCTPSSRKRDAEVSDTTPLASSASSASQAVRSPDSERIYDVVLFGATGFTGRLAALYLAKTYGNSVKWAIAGRRRDGLEKLKSDLVLINPGLSELAIILADSNDLDSLTAMCRSTRVVATTAGPFDKYGSELVRSCAETGTHYCDITGETDWVRKMVDMWDDTARQTGARIVNFCGHDCVPWDLAVLELHRKLRASGNDSIAEVHCYDELAAAPSGGTLATIFHSLGNRIKYKSKLGFDPLLKSTTGEKTMLKFKSKNASFLGYSDEFGAWIGPFFMAMVMANCVRRSQTLAGYSPKILYSECQVYPSFFAGFVTLVDVLVFASVLLIPPLRWTLLSLSCLPNPGEGPSEAFMDSGFLKVTAFGTGTNGGKAKVVFYFPTDPGYRDTARMLIESALVLALQIKDVKVGGGIWTPATCQGELLTQRLVATGSSIEIE